MATGKVTMSNERWMAGVGLAIGLCVGCSAEVGDADTTASSGRGDLANSERGAQGNPALVFQQTLEHLRRRFDDARAEATSAEEYRSALTKLQEALRSLNGPPLEAMDQR